MPMKPYLNYFYCVIDCVRQAIMTAALFAVFFFSSCERVDHSGENPEPSKPAIPLENVAKMLSALPIESCHVQEVRDAVSSSSGNGYDEEYMMRDLFTSPGAGVGMDKETKAVKAASYSRPLKDLISEFLEARTKAGETDDLNGMSASEYLYELENSDIQIYWPYSDVSDEEQLPIVTFDPGNGAEVNVGYKIFENKDGVRTVEEVVVDESVAASRPVWVVNRNGDSSYRSLEMIRMDDPQWGTGGGSIVVRPSGTKALDSDSEGVVKSLVLKDFKMRRNYDCWFAGASEFVFKCGSVEGFTASTEAELKLYSPEITDFMLVVKRSQVGQTIPLNVMLVSEWTDQLDNVVFLLTEDDGGTRTDWKCSAVVKIKSKSYGFEVSLPFNSRDDLVWRGQLSAKYLEKYSDVCSRFGDVDITFSFLER